MTLLEAFAAIFTGTWLFISSPGVMVFVGILALIVGIWMFMGACVVPHKGRTEFWQRTTFFVGGPLVAIVGIAVMMWAGTSSIDPISWR